MKKRAAAIVLVVSVVALSASCVASVADEPIGDAVEPGIHYGTGPSAAETALRAWRASHPGPCAPACLTAAARGCPWDQVCGDTDFVECAGVTLTCTEAEDAASGDLVGLSCCWERCAGSHP